MKGKFRSLAVGVAAAATIAGVGVMAGGGAAFAAGGGGGTPPWYPISPAPYGSIIFYNAQGQVITGGQLSAHGLGAYAVASTASPDPSVYSEATLELYTPLTTENPLEWTGTPDSSASTFPNTSAPGVVGATTNPTVTTSASATTLASYIAGNPNTTGTDANLYDVRMIESAPGVSPDTNFWDTVISVNTTAGTWSVDYPDYTQNTTTTLTATPPSPQTAPAGAITLTATVSPATAGTVTFWNETTDTQVGTAQSVTTSDATASVPAGTPPNGTTQYEAIFEPPAGSADIGSDGTTSYVVNVPLDNTATTLAETGGSGPAGTSVAFTGTVTDTTSTTTPVTTGTVSLYSNSSSSPFASGAVSATGTFSINYSFPLAGAQSVVATFSGNSTQATSTSVPVTFTVAPAACSACTDVQTIEGTVPAGTISISTPYTPGNPLNLGTLALNAAGTYFTASASLDTGGATDVPGVNFNGITVVDTQSGDLPWTVSALASNLSDGTGHPGGTISGENVGLTNLTPVFVSGNAIQAGDVTVTNQPAATPPVGPTDTGSLGLGGTVAHTIAADSAVPDGTVGINGTVTLNAPTSTEAGLFTGTITFTIAS
jgi:hypothetical protein